jgi:hypothetical protein
MIEVELPAWLAPRDQPDLTRVGGNNDGGYVIPRRAIADADGLIAMGIGSNWHFEREAHAINPKLQIHAYDHTVSERLFRRQALAHLATWLLRRGTFAHAWRQVRRWWDFRSFFGGSATHYEQRIAASLVPTVFERISGPLLVKIDIEGTEYEILEHVLDHADRILGLVIEWHEIRRHQQDFDRLMRRVCERFTVVHVHGNNFGPADRRGADALEVSLMRRELIPSSAPPVSRLPRPDLDHPNDPSRPDYQLTFAGRSS